MRQIKKHYIILIIFVLCTSNIFSQQRKKNNVSINTGLSVFNIYKEKGPAFSIKYKKNLLNFLHIGSRIGMTYGYNHVDDQKAFVNYRSVTFLNIETGFILPYKKHSVNISGGMGYNLYGGTISLGEYETIINGNSYQIDLVASSRYNPYFSFLYSFSYNYKFKNKYILGIEYYNNSLLKDINGIYHKNSAYTLEIGILF